MEMATHTIFAIGSMCLVLLKLVCTEESNSTRNTPTVNLQQLCPRGIRLWMADAPDISFVGYHVSINNPLIGASPSEYSIDLGRPTASRWTFDLPDAYLQKGDKVFYWLHIVTTNQSYVKTDMTWTVTESACSHTNATNLQWQRSVTVFGKVPVCAGQLIFEEQFNNLDFDIWQHENTGSGGRFSEFNMFVNNRSNSFVSDGILHIRPTITADVYGEDFLYNGVLDLRDSSPVGEKCTDPGNNGCYRRAVGAQILNPVLSAKIQTSQSFTFQYGIVKIRAKMPKGDWLWPAVSLLPKHSVYGEWPKSGQIAIVQSRGNSNLRFGNENLGVQRVEIALEYGPEKSADISKNSIRTHSNSRENEDWSTDYHVFQLDWRPDGMQFLIDGKSAMNVTPPTGGGLKSLLPSSTNISLASGIYQDGSKIAPFDQQFYLVISLVVGGVSGYFPDNAVNTPHHKPWNNTSPTPALDFWEKRDDWWPDWNLNHSEFLIDYIKIWALP